MSNQMTEEQYREKMIQLLIADALQNPTPSREFIRRVMYYGYKALPSWETWELERAIEEAYCSVMTGYTTKGWVEQRK